MEHIQSLDLQQTHHVLYACGTGPGTVHGQPVLTCFTSRDKRHGTAAPSAQRMEDHGPSEGSRTPEAPSHRICMTNKQKTFRGLSQSGAEQLMFLIKQHICSILAMSDSRGKEGGRIKKDHRQTLTLKSQKGSMANFWCC